MPLSVDRVTFHVRDASDPTLAGRLHDLVRAGYLEPDPNCAAPSPQGIYRITFSGIYAADNH